MANSIEQKQKDIIADFEFLEEWEDKYGYIIDLGKQLNPLEEKYKTEENLVQGCQSQVWLTSELSENQELNFKADSDAIITKGLIALLVNVFSKQKPSAIAKANVDFINQIGLREHLSPTRSNGLLSMLKKMKNEALKYC